MNQVLQLAVRQTMAIVAMAFENRAGQYPMIHGGGDLMERWGGVDDDNVKQPPHNLRYDILQLVKKYSWAEMVDGSRTIFSTYPIVAGAVKEKADNVVGDAWEPIYVGGNEEWGKRATEMLVNWHNICDMRGRPYDWATDLHIASMDLDRSGDAIFLLRANEQNYPLIQPLEAHRVCTRAPNGIIQEGQYKNLRLVNGVVYDDNSRPVAFAILGDTPDQDQFYEARACYHVYDPIWFSQGRGIPSIAFGMNDWVDSKSIKDNEKRAQDILTRITLVETNATGRPDAANNRVTRRAASQSEGGGAGSDPVPPASRGSLFTQKIERGEIRFIQANKGHGLESMKIDRPSTGSLAHYELVLRGAFMGMDWPIEWAYSLAELGGAVARAMTGKINRTVSRRQNVLYPHAKGITGWAVAKFMQNKELPFDPDWYKWDFSMPAESSCDDGRDSENDRSDLDSMLTSFTDIFRKRGKSFQKAAKQKFDDLTFIKKLIKDETPVTMADMRALGPNPVATPGEPTPGTPGGPQRPGNTVPKKKKAAAAA